MTPEPYARSQALFRLHHDQRPALTCSIHWNYREPPPPGLQHKRKLIPGFTSRYNLTRLVYYEMFIYPDVAISREKEIKGWRRSKKIRLIESMNPHWHDFASEWQDMFKPTRLNSFKCAVLPE